MYIIDGIAYAGERTRAIRVSGVKPLPDYKLWLRFNTGEIRIFDFKPLLSSAGFAPLNDVETFREVYIDYGVTTWLDGDVDIDPEYLYEQSTPISRAEETA